MNDEPSIPKRLAKIKALVSEYFPLEKGALIDKHSELLRVVDIRGARCTEHPHRKCRVYISRRAVKHVVEERKDAYLINHTEEETIEAICFAIDTIPETLMDYDKYEHQPKEKPPTHFYAKDYSNLGKPGIRIVVEHKNNTLEIRSIHFRRNIK